MKMTSTKLIGRETMISRLVYFHDKRIDRAFPNHTKEWRKEKKDFFSVSEYSTKTTRSICKEYDDTFSDSDYPKNYADFQTP